MRVVYEFIIERLHGRILRNPSVQVAAVVPVDCVAVCDRQLSAGRVGNLCQQAPLTLVVSPADVCCCVGLQRTHLAVIIAIVVNVCPFL